MNKFFTTLATVCLLALTNLHAQTVKYTYKPLAPEGCVVMYSIIKQSNDYFIVVTVESDKLVFSEQPSCTMTAFDSHSLNLKGTLISNVSDTTYFMLGGISIPAVKATATAHFKISEKELPFLKKGITEIHLSLTPYEHNRSFEKDEIGSKLFEIYQKVRHENAPVKP